MPAFAAIKTFIYLVSSSLLYPTLLILAVLTLAIIYYAGACFAEWTERFRLRKFRIDGLRAKVLANDIGGIMSPRVITYTDELRGLIKRSPDSVIETEYLIQARSSELLHSLDKVKLIIRLGPALGLIGTLIPMGTGLAGLGQGDMTRLSSDLVLAFTTTVVGLAVGMLAYLMFMLRKRWIEEDIRNIEYITEILQDEIPEKAKISARG